MSADALQEYGVESAMIGVPLLHLVMAFWEP